MWIVYSKFQKTTSKQRQEEAFFLLLPTTGTLTNSFQIGNHITAYDEAGNVLLHQDTWSTDEVTPWEPSVWCPVKTKGTSQKDCVCAQREATSLEHKVKPLNKYVYIICTLSHP